MALVDPIIGRMSGKIAGLVFMNGPGGSSVRSWQVPTNPNTPAQQAIRSAQTQLSNRWVATLTPAQRADWETYAANVTVPGRFGNPINLSGISMYVRCNTPRIQWFGGAAMLDAAPTIFNLGEMTAPSMELVNTATFNVTFNAADDWVSEDGAAMFVYCSRNQNESKNFFKGPYRQTTDFLLGSSGAPPASPQVLTLPFPAVDGNRTFFFVRVSRGDGRLSAAWRGFALATFV